MAIQDLTQNTTNLITFVLVDSNGDEVAGLGDAFTLTISKNGGAFAASAGTKAEIGSGWYSYLFTASECDTIGALSIVITHASIKQQNLAYEVKVSGVVPTGSGDPTIEDCALPIPLDIWRGILGYHPWHFWGQANNTTPGLKVTSSCNTVVTEYSWQASDAVGRDEIRQAIQSAADKIREYLGYRVGACYTQKTLQYPRPYDARMQYSRPAGGDGRYLSINVGEGYIKAIGLQTRVLLAQPSVTYNDNDGDGVAEQFSISFSTTVTNPAEIAVYFAGGDRLNSEAVSEKWRIEPVQVSISSGTCTVIGPAWILVRPIKLQGLATSAIDPTDTGAVVNNFAQTLEVYRRYTDADGTTIDTAQAVLVWETEPPDAYWCQTGVTDLPTFDPYRFDPAAQGYAIARAQIRDARLGEITVGQAVYDSDNDRFVAVNWGAYRQPDRVIIRYLAGADRSEVKSQVRGGGNWDQTVARLAMGEMSQRICACDNANHQLYHWQFDLSRAAGANDEQYTISEQNLNAPFGTSRGAIYAWKQVQQLQITRGFVVG